MHFLTINSKRAKCHIFNKIFVAKYIHMSKLIKPLKVYDINLRVEACRVYNLPPVLHLNIIYFKFFFVSCKE